VEILPEGASSVPVRTDIDDRVWNLPMPATSRREAGVLVPIPTKFERSNIVGTERAVVEFVLKRVCAYPGSKRISPVVVTRIRSAVELPRKKRSSCVPTPVLSSAMAVLL